MGFSLKIEYFMLSGGLDMNFPFEIQSVLETMSERPLVLSSNLFNKFNVIQEVVLSKSGKVPSMGSWGVEDGALRLLDDNGHLVTEFRSIETRNGCVYAVGRNVLESTAVNPRPILNIKKPVGDDFGIVISSHINYEKLAVPRIIRSLEGDGFDVGKIVVVIGNDKDNDGIANVCPELGVMTFRTRKDIFGMTALNNIPDASKRPYWLLLHDTCEVINGFVKNISNLDVGLNPDVVLFRPPTENVEFGLYRSEFISLCSLPVDTKPFDYLNMTMQKASIISILNSSFKQEPEKDVYGKGIVREVINFNTLGFKKYRSKISDSKKP